ncbi:MAG: hypothetical protein WC595_00220 [Candidatus Nanoarchaeia archaeon]
MTTNQHWYNLPSDNKGFIFTLDAFIASLIFLTTLLFTTYAVSQAAEFKTTNIYLIATASDALAALDNTNVLETLNATLIQNQTITTLPPYYGYKLTISRSSGPALELGEEVPTGTFIGSATRYFKTPTDYGQARMRIWLKA